MKFMMIHPVDSEKAADGFRTVAVEKKFSSLTMHDTLAFSISVTIHFSDSLVQGAG